jgi:hypothetical protein
MFVDGNYNKIQVRYTHYLYQGDRPIVIVTLLERPQCGYIALDEGLEWGGFGDETLPSSYGMSCMSWFGPGETYGSADEAIKAIIDSQ